MTQDIIVDSQEAVRIINKAFNGQRNVMTPWARGFYLTRYYAIELSEGDSIENCHTRNGGLFGVTVVDRKTGEPRRDLSKCVHSRREADAYITQLKNLKD